MFFTSGLAFVYSLVKDWAAAVTHLPDFGLDDSVGRKMQTAAVGKRRE